MKPLTSYLAWWTALVAVIIGTVIALIVSYSDINNDRQKIRIVDVDTLELANSQDPQLQRQAITGLIEQWRQLDSQQRCLIASHLLQSQNNEVRHQALTALLAQHGPNTTELPPLAWVADDATLARRLILAMYWTEAKLHWPESQSVPQQLIDLVDSNTGQLFDPPQPNTSNGLPINISATSRAPNILIALEAERLNTPEQNESLSKAWLVDLSDHKKKTGALLAALTNKNLEQLQEAFYREDEPSVLAIQYLALAIAGIDVEATPPLPPADELAWRSMHQHSEGGLDLNMLAIGLALGESSFLEVLVKTKTDSLTELSERLQLLQRFTPSVANRISPPPTTSKAHLRRYQASLVALFELCLKQLVFNQENLQFELIDPIRPDPDNPSKFQQLSYDCPGNDKESTTR